MRRTEKPELNEADKENLKRSFKSVKLSHQDACRESVSTSYDELKQWLGDQESTSTTTSQKLDDLLKIVKAYSTDHAIFQNSFAPLNGFLRHLLASEKRITVSDFVAALNGLSPTEIECICDALKYYLPKIIIKASDFNDVLRMVGIDQIAAVCDALKAYLPKIIKNGRDFGAALNGLGPTEIECICDALKDDLTKIIIKDSDLDEALQMLNRDQRTAVCEPFVDRLHNADRQKCIKQGSIEQRICFLHIAAQKGYEDVVQLLIKGAVDVNQADDDGCTPLWLAAWRGHHEVVNLLLRKDNIKVNRAAADQCSPLWIAAQNGYDKVVNLLLGKTETNIDQAVDSSGYAPLHIAARNGHTEIVILLLDKADVNAKGPFSYTPLHVAVQYGCTEIVEILLHKNVGADVNAADVNAKDDAGNTPLHIAALNRHTEIVELLLDHKVKADVNAKDDEDKTPLHIAEQLGHKSIVELIKIHVAALKQEQNIVSNRSPFFTPDALKETASSTTNENDLYSVLYNKGECVLNAIILK